MTDTSLDFQGLFPYQIPHKLISIIWSTVSSPQIADMSEQAMTKLWRLEPKRLPHGYKN